MFKKLLVIVLLCALLVPAIWAQGEEETDPMKGEISFLSPETDPSAVKLDQEIIRRFEEKYPGATVNLDHADLDTLLPKISAQLRAGTAPDVAYFSPRWVGDLIAQNQLVPLDDVFTKIGDVPRNLVVPTKDGKTYDIPLIMESSGLYYRKDLLEEAGLEPPTTWDEMLNVVKTLTMDTDGDGKIDIYGYGSAGVPEIFSNFVRAFVWANGGAYFDENNKVAIDDSNAIEAFEFVGKLLEYAPPGVSNVEYADLGAMFAKGKVATAVYPGRMLLHIARYAPEMKPEQVGFVPIPQGPKGDTPVILSFVNDMVVFNTDEKEELAKAFVEFYLADEQYLDLIRQATPGHALPVRSSFKESEEYFAPDPSNDNHLMKWREVIQKSIDYASQYATNYYLIHPGVLKPDYGKATTSPIYFDTLGDFVAGKVTAREGFRKVADKWRADYE